MQLVYLWIEKYKNFKNVEFNFHPQYRIHYDKDSEEIEVNKINEDYVDIYNDEEETGKGRISNVTAIVGNNGAGKTSLMEFIYSHIVQGNFKKSEKFIAAFLNGEDIKIYHSIGNNEKLNCDPKYKAEYIYDSLGSNQSVDKKYLNKLYFVYHTNTLDGRSYNNKNTSANIADISLSSLIKNYPTIPTKNYYKEKDNIINFINNEIRTQLRFLLKYKDKTKVLLFKLPKEINIEIIDSIKVSEKTQKKLNDMKIYKIINNSIMRESENDYRKIILKNFFTAALNNLFAEMIEKPVAHKNYEVIEELRDYEIEQEQDEDIFTYCKKLLEGIETRLHSDIEKHRVKSYINLVTKISELYENNCFDNLNVRNNSAFSLEVDNDKLLELFNAYDNTCSNYQYLNFTWGLSSGENTLLGLYARLFCLVIGGKIKSKYNNGANKSEKCTNVILLMDEADLTLHPEWQQKYLKSLIDFVKDIYNECNIQIIIATHSPILLSDIMNSNIIFLKKEHKGRKTIVEDSDKHEQTFGANIYDLYRDGFFLTGNEYGILGAFASEKIKYVFDKLDKCNNILNKLNDNKEKIDIDINKVMKDLNNCKKIIDIIGEQFVKDILIEKYYYLYNEFKERSNIKVDRRPEELKNILNKLTKDEQEKLMEYIKNSNDNKNKE